MKNNKSYYVFFCLLLSIYLPIQSLDAKEIVEPDRQSSNQLGKTDFDRMADHEIRENIQSLRIHAKSVSLALLFNRTTNLFGEL